MEREINQAAVDFIAKLGGPSHVSRAAGVSRQAVFKWAVHGIPPGKVEVLKAAFPRGGWSRAGKAIGKGRRGR
jgi:hypothetical protein